MFHGLQGRLNEISAKGKWPKANQNTCYRLEIHKHISAELSRKNFYQFYHIKSAHVNSVIITEYLQPQTSKVMLTVRLFSITLQLL